MSWVTWVENFANPNLTYPEFPKKNPTHQPLKNQPKILGWWAKHTPLVNHNHKNKTKYICPACKFCINTKILPQTSFLFTPPRKALIIRSNPEWPVILGLDLRPRNTTRYQRAWRKPSRWRSQEQQQCDPRPIVVGRAVAQPPPWIGFFALHFRIHRFPSFNLNFFFFNWILIITYLLLHIHYTHWHRN